MQTQPTNQPAWETLLQQAKPEIVKALKRATELNKQVKAQKLQINRKLRKTYKSQSF
jgi:hypothetical protein